jgi:hypothetical protein
MRRAAAFEERRSVARSVYVIASVHPNHSQRDDFAEWERQQAFPYRMRLRPRRRLSPFHFSGLKTF